MQATMHRRRACRVSHPRRGLATLETVMSVPPLLALAAMMFAMASASIRKADCVVAARHAAWAHRSERPGTPFPEAELGHGLVAEVVERATRKPGGMASIGSSSSSAISKNHIHINPWDDPHAGFAVDAPHFTPTFRMAAEGFAGQFDLQTYFNNSDASENGALEDFLKSGIGSSSGSDVSNSKKVIQDSFSGSDSPLQHLAEQIAQSNLEKFGGFFDSVKGMKGVDAGALREVARGMNFVVLVAGETLGVAADLIDPSQVIDGVIKKLPQPFRGVAQAVVSNSLVGKVEDAVGDALKGVLGDNKESDKDKALKGIVGLIDDVHRLLDEVRNAPKIIAEPMRNLRDAAHGVDNTTGPTNGSAIIDQLNDLHDTLNDLESKIKDLTNALKKVGIS